MNTHPAITSNSVHITDITVGSQIRTRPAYGSMRVETVLDIREGGRPGFLFYDITTDLGGVRRIRAHERFVFGTVL